MAKTGFFIDFSEFEKMFYDLTQVKMIKSAKVGEFEAANEVLRDSIEIPPQTPKKFGDLWGSRKVEAVKEDNKDISIMFGFNIFYATKQHEAHLGTFRYTKDKGATFPGPKFMQVKMLKNRRKYMGIVAEAIRRTRG